MMWIQFLSSVFAPVAAAGSADSPGSERSSANQAPRSTILQRSLQNGRQRDSAVQTSPRRQVGQRTRGASISR